MSSPTREERSASLSMDCTKLLSSQSMALGLSAHTYATSQTAALCCRRTLCKMSPEAVFEITMTAHCNDELATNSREIATKQRHIENQAALIEALERDGYDVGEKRSSLAKERSSLAVQIAQQFRLLEASCGDE